MLEETGIVVGVEHGYIQVETQPRSACANCGAGSCTTSVVSKLFGARHNRLRLPSSLHAKVGQRVVIGIPDQVLISVSLRAYLLPLLTMMLGAVCANALGHGETLQAVIALLGLVLGLGFVGRFSESKKAREQYSPRILRLLGQPAIQVQPTDMTRNKT